VFSPGKHFFDVPKSAKKDQKDMKADEIIRVFSSLDKIARLHGKKWGSPEKVDSGLGAVCSLCKIAKE
jgi:hypothetical protein